MGQENKVVERIQEMLDKGQKVLATKTFGFTGVPTTDLQAFTEWRSQVITLLIDEIGENHVYLNQFKTEVDRNFSSKVELGLGILEAVKNDFISENIQPKIKEQLNEELFPISIVQGKNRDYIVRIAVQANGCYQQGWYDACAVMIRRLIETLIVECFESKKIDMNIKDKDENFFYLERLIVEFSKETSFNPSRNTKESLKKLPKLKALGDLSAHNRHYTATKKDINDIKEHIRVIIQELFRIAFDK